MSAAKVVVLYPVPTDADAFDRAYTNEHGPISTGGMPVFLVVAEDDDRTFN